MKYNTMYAALRLGYPYPEGLGLDVAFSVGHNFEDSDKLLHTSHGRQLVLAALAKRLAILMENQEECSEAFGNCDTCEIPQCDIGIAHD
jgi:hypothetical protein